MERMTQRRAVLNYLMEHGTITSMEAFEKFGATRLSAIIFDLRRQGYGIFTNMVETTNRFGQTLKYARYRLVSCPPVGGDEDE